MVSFNYWFNGEFQVITLADGESVDLHSGGQTEEGWSRTDIRFTRDGDLVRMDVSTDGTDCDGRLSSDSQFTCGLDKLGTWETPDGTLTPNWELAGFRQHDQYAEAMNY